MKLSLNSYNYFLLIIINLIILNSCQESSFRFSLETKVEECFSGGSGTFAGSINEFIKGSGASQWIDAVGSYQSIIEKSLIDAYG